MAGKKSKTSDARKAMRAASIRRSEDRKAQRRRVQAEAEARNKALRARGEMTPWEAAKARARERKTAAPRQEIS